MKPRERSVGIQLPYLLGFLLRGQFRLAWNQWKNGRRLASGSGLHLHLGCGRRRLKGCVNIDVHDSPATDYLADIARLPCADNSVTVIENYHVIEHVPHTRISDVLSEWLRVLRPGGTLIIECPDLDRAAAEYLEGNEDRLYSIFGRQRFSGDTHYWGFNARRLRNLLQAVGFVDVVECEPRDYHASAEPCLRIECAKPLEVAVAVRSGELC